MPNGTLNRNYVKNMCQWLKDHGYAPKYDHAGIYCIKLNNQLVYIGKSHNMLQRVAQHYVGQISHLEQCAYPPPRHIV